MDDEVVFLLQAAKTDAQGWQSLISTGKLPLSLLLSCLLHRTCPTTLSGAQRAILWGGLLRAAERATEEAPCGYLVAAALAQAVVTAACTGSCPVYISAATPVAEQVSASAAAGAASTGAAAAGEQWTLKQVWDAYEAAWPQALAMELAAQHPDESAGPSSASTSAPGQAGSTPTLDRSTVTLTPSAAQVEEVKAGVSMEERLALNAARELVDTLCKSTSTPFPADMRVRRATDATRMRLQCAVVAARALRRAVAECVAREEILLTGKAGGAGAADGAAAAAAKKKKKKKGKKKASSSGAAGSGTPSAVAAGGKEEDEEEEEDGEGTPAGASKSALASPAPMAAAAPTARRHPFALHLLALPPSVTGAGSVGVGAAAEGGDAWASMGKALPVDPLYRSILSSTLSSASSEAAGTVTEGDSSAQGQQQAACVESLKSITTSWAQYASAALTDEGMSRAIIAPTPARLSASSGQLAPPAESPSSSASVPSGTSPAGSASSGTMPVLAGTIVRSAALAGVGGGGGAGVSVKAAHAAGAARVKLGMGLVHSLAATSVGLPPRGLGWSPALPAQAVVDAAASLAQGQGITVVNAAAGGANSSTSSGAGASALPLLTPEEEESLTDDALVTGPLTPAEETWVEAAAEGLAPRVAPQPVPAFYASAFVALCALQAQALCAAGDIPAARGVHEKGYWWLAEHVLLPAHTASNGAGLDGEEDTGATMTIGTAAAAVPTLTPAHYDVCLSALTTWVAFETSHASRAEDEDYPAFLAEDLRRRAGADAARNVLLAYAEAARAAAVALVKSARHALLAAQVSKQRAASAAAAAHREAVVKAVEERKRQQAEEQARRKAAAAAAAAIVLQATSGGKSGKGKSASVRAKAKLAPAPPPPPPPPPPPSLASLKASASADEKQAQAGKHKEKQAAADIEPRLDLSAVLARVLQAAVEAGQLGTLPLPAAPPIPDVPDA